MTKETFLKAKQLNKDIEIMNNLFVNNTLNGKTVIARVFESSGSDITEGQIVAFSDTFITEFTAWIQSQKTSYEQQLEEL